MEAASTSKTSVYFYQTTRHNNPEDSHPQCKTSLKDVLGGQGLDTRNILKIHFQIIDCKKVNCTELHLDEAYSRVSQMAAINLMGP
jgi:hypothetical protein